MTSSASTEFVLPVSFLPIRPNVLLALLLYASHTRVEAKRCGMLQAKLDLTTHRHSTPSKTTRPAIIATARRFQGKLLSKEPMIVV